MTETQIPQKMRRQIAALDDEDAAVRREAALKLGKQGDRAAVEPLLRALQDAKWKVRRNAVISLGRIGDYRAVSSLCQTLADSTAIVRRESATALGRIGVALAVEPLLRAMDDEKESVREEAGNAILKIGGFAVAPLCLMLSSEEPGLRFHATWALSEIYRYARVETTETILTDARLSPQQRWQGLEAIRTARPSWLHFNWLGDVQEFCESVLTVARIESVSSENPEVAGARAVLEYMTLARPSQRDLAAEKTELLRASHGSEARDGHKTLLRASDADEDDEIELELETRRTFLGRLKRLLRIGQRSVP